jgi:hypothetical protein
VGSGRSLRPLSQLRNLLLAPVSHPGFVHSIGTLLERRTAGDRGDGSQIIVHSRRLGVVQEPGA